MLNLLWPIIIIVSIVYAIINNNIEELNSGIFEYSKEAVNLSITFLGTMCLWNGIMKIAKSTSIMDKIKKMLKPFINILFPKLRNNEKIKEEISLNIVANIMGLGNASTPLGIKAMKSMQKENKNKDTLTDSMMMFILINTASIQLIPSNVIAIRMSLGSENPSQVIVPIWIATLFAAIAGITATKFIIYKTRKRENKQ